MEVESFYFLSTSSLLLLLIILLPKLLQLNNRRRKNHPPGPPSLPIIGHLHLIKEPVHRSLHRISDRYGPIFSISFGCRPVVVVSSPAAVEECFVKNDVAFAGRPNLEGWRELSYDFTTIGAATYGPLWRNLRRICALEIFSTTRLQSFLAIRQEEQRVVVKSLWGSTGAGEFVKSSNPRPPVKVEMKTRLQELSFNVIMRMVSGKRFYGAEVEAEDMEQAREFRDIISEVFELSAASDPGDFVPLLRLVDFQGRRKRTTQTKRKVDVLLQRLIDERRNITNKLDAAGAGANDDERKKKKTIIDTMVELQASEPQLYTDDIIKGVILTLLAAGTDTSSVTIEWAMSLLLNNPDKLTKARAEIDNTIGFDRLVEESDLQNLPYLQNIINEALRLFPPAPLLVPHEAIEEATIGGFNVPKGTMLMVNAWAIHRDPKVWDDPTSFKPERYQGMNNHVDPFRLLPFGLGRRGCPGAGLANRVVGSALGVLIQCFEWERVGEELVDLREGTGLTMPKAQALEALCKTRSCMLDVVSHL